MAIDADERDKSVDLPSWWLEKVRGIVDDRKALNRESLGELARNLSEAVGRADPWDHSKVSRFLRNKNTTVPMAEAFSKLFVIPRPFFVAQSEDEAVAHEQVSRRYEGKQLNPDQKRRLVTVDQIADAAHDEAKGQTRGISSKDEGATRGRRTGRAARGRSPAS
jgi:hypothetical protein